MQEIRNLEKILAELEYLNTSILAKIEALEKKGVIKDFEKILKKINNSESILERLDEISLILKVIFYAVLADKQLLSNVKKVAEKLGDEEVLEFLDRNYKKN